MFIFQLIGLGLVGALIGLIVKKIIDKKQKAEFIKKEKMLSKEE